MNGRSSSPRLEPCPSLRARWRSALRASALALACAFGVEAWAQSVPFESSNLPIVLIDTDGEEIPDEPKITARMRVIDNGPAERNRVGDTPNGYDGWIGIEIRGATSKIYPKKQFAVETRTADGENRNVELLGMPRENDWVLNGPYADKAMMRNVLAYGLARSMGRYASRTRYCEVVLNGEYWGLYVLQERIKRDDNRVDINTLKPSETAGDDLTGGYIVKVDKVATTIEEEGWTSPYGRSFSPEGRIRWLFHEPEADEVTPEQAAYIERTITDFESVFLRDDYDDPQTGYPALVDIGSFVDFVLLVEVFKNPDGYRSSTYVYKDKDSIDGRLVAGPAWDFNYSAGNAAYLRGDHRDGFHFQSRDQTDTSPVPFWWPHMIHSEPFLDVLRPRWAELRAGALHLDTLEASIDSLARQLDEAQERNEARWSVLGEYVWPNEFVGGTYAAEIAYLKEYFRERIGWLDGAFAVITGSEDGPAEGEGLQMSLPYPNPARGRSWVDVAGRGTRARLDVIDVQGRHVRSVWDGAAAPDPIRVELPVGELAAGVYLLRLAGDAGVRSQTFVVLGR